MNKKILLDGLKSLGIFGGIFILFYVGLNLLSEDKKNKWFYSDEKISLISYEQEIALGELIDEYIIASQYKNPLTNKTIDSMMWAVSKRLQGQIPTSEYDYNITVLDNPQINAFTIPGGNIYVFSGLISFCDSPEQLAAVLAHEMGHVEKRHTVDRLAREFSLSVLFSIMTGGDTVLLSDLYQTLISSGFSRSQEKEADQFALNLLEDASISPKSIASFFRKLNRENLAYDEKIELVMTHPHNNSRIKASLNHEVDDTFDEIPFELNWEEIKAAL
jgi:predicted Zn-dependent protease|tara:strand:- start:458 stop:1282 length:825 start_codon:yes stop_codon:yes gene_type:complete